MSFLASLSMLGTIWLASWCLGSEQPAAAPPAVQADSSGETAESAAATPPPATPSEEKPAPVPAAPAKPPRPVRAAAPPVKKPVEAPKSLAERRLRFSFKAQLWEEVLEMFAEQAGLSLVMDHPPQGSFNYMDDKEYSPIEGIDLLNKVLMTKGFTLIRNEQMLMVMDLSEGIPQGIVPVVTLDDLKERGDFELVSMKFDLGRRDVTAVTQEITALLGPNGTAASLPASKKILITDTAGIMTALEAVIKSIPEPAPPKTQPKPKDPVKPEKPELKMHPIKHADPAMLMEVLKQFFPSDKLTLDEKNRRFSAHTGISRHEAIIQVLKKIDVVDPEGVERILEVYPVEIGPPSADPRDSRSRNRRRFLAGSSEEDPAAPLIELLKKAVPQAQITYDQAGQQLVVWATSEEHTKLQATLDKIVGGGPSDRTPRVEAYPLEKLDPDSTLTMFQTLLPDAQISLDTKSRVLVALATGADHDAIRATIEKMSTAESGEHAPALKVYPVAMDASTAIIQALSDLVPDAQVTEDTENKRLVAIATKAQHESIQATIDELSASGTSRNNMLLVYPVKSADPASVLELMENLYPRLTILLDTKGNRLMVWARAEEHASIKLTLEQLTSASAAEGQRHFQTYTIRGTGRRNTSPVTIFLPKLQELAPDAEMTPDATGGKLLVWGTDAEHAKIAAALAKMGQGDTPEGTPVIKRYSFTKADPTSTMTLLQTLVPEAQLSIDTQTNEMIALAIPGDQEKIKSTLEQLQPAQPGPDDPVLKFHPITEELPADVITLLQTQVPRAKITADVKNKRLMVIASPADHDLIATTIAQVEEGGSTEPELRFIALEEPLPTSVMSLLAIKAPGATITPDPANKRLMIVASPADHEVITTLVEQATAAGSTAPKMQFLALEEKVPASVLSVVQTLVPDAQVTVDDDGKTLMVVASPTDFEKVKTTISEAMNSLGPEEENSLVVYPVTPALRARAEAVLASITAELPGIQILPDTDSGSLSIWAKPTQHKIIAGVFEQLTREIPDKDKYTLVAYPMRSSDAASVMDMLTQLFPNTQIVLEAKTNRLLTWTRPDEHAAIRSALDQIELAGAPDEQPRFKTFSIKGAIGLNPTSQAAAAAAIVEQLQSLVPNAKLTMDAKAGKLLAFGTPSELDVIGLAVAELGHGETVSNDSATLELYELTKAEPSSTMTLLEGLVPGAEITLDSASQRLLVFATPEDHEAVRSTLELLQPDSPSPNDPQIFFYLMEDAPPAALVAGLQDLVPDAKVTYDDEGKTLMVVAKPADQKVIEQAVKEMGAKLPEKEKNTLKIYPATPDQRKRFEATVEVIKADMPEIQIVADEDGANVSVWAKPSEHEIIGEVLEQLRSDISGEGRRSFDVYPIQGESGYVSNRRGSFNSATVLLTGLEEIVPGAKLMLEPDGRKIIAWATAEEHEMIAEAVAKLDSGTREKAPRFEVYTVQGAMVRDTYGRTIPNAGLIAGLQTLAPDARMTVDAASGTLVVWGTPEDQEIISAAVEKLDGGDSEENRPQLQVYQLITADPSTVLTTLGQLIPQAQLSVDSQSGSIVALAVPADQEVIRATLEKLQPAAEGPSRRELLIYPFAKTPPASVVTALEALIPNAQVTMDADGKHLTVVATPAEHALIKESIDKLQESAPIEEDPYFEAYSLDNIGGPMGSSRYTVITTLMSTLTPLVPDAKLSLDYTSGKLIAWATAKNHEKLKAAIEKLIGDDSPDNTRIVEIHPITTADPTATTTLLQTMVPESQLSIETISGNLIALAVPADQEIIRKTLEQLQPAEPGENTPEIVLYSFTERPPTSVVSGLQTLAPKCSITVDPDGKHLMIVATPADHVRIKASIDKLEAADVMKDKPYFDAYALTGIGGPPGYSRYAIVSALLPTLSPMVPDARLTVDTQTGRLIVWATAKDHEKLTGAIEKLVGDGSPDNTRIVEIHPITKADPTATTTLLLAMVPEAQLSIETTTGNLIALAVPADQEIIRKTLEQLQPAEPGPNSPEIRFYQLSKPAPATLIPGLTGLVPKAQLTLGPKGERLMVVATPADHAVVKANLEKIDAAASMEEQNTLKVYPVTPAERKRFNSLLPTITADLPGVQVITDAEPGELSIWARPSQHASIAKILDELKREVPDGQKYKVVGYSVKSSDITSMITVLTSLFPDTQFTPDARARRILAYTTPAQHAEIAAAMEELEGDTTETGEEKFVSHRVPPAISATVIGVLRELLPGVTMYPDTARGSIIAWGLDTDHEVIAKTIEQLQVEPESKFKPYLMVYPPGESDVMALYSLLRTLAPQATVVPDATNRTLSVFATAKDHETVQSTINSTSATAAGSGQRTVQTYSLENQTVASVTVLLRNIVPLAQCSTGVDTQQLVVSAFAQDHRKIKQAIEQLEAAGPPDTLPVLKRYRVKSTTAAAASVGLRQIVPTAIFSTGTTDPQELIVWARPADHEKIQRVVDELSKDPPAEMVATFEVYGLENITFATASYILTLSVPQARISAGVEPHQLIAWARPDDHELVQATLDQIDVKGPDDKIARAKMYELDTGNATKDYYIANYLRTAVPTATFATGVDSTQLVAWARPVDHEKIAALLEELTPADGKSKLVAYSLTSITVTEATTILRQIVPTIQLTPGANPHQLLAWAPLKEHEKLKELLEGIDVEGSPEDKPTTETYALKHIATATASQLLTMTMPQVTFSTGADPKQLIAVGRPIDHEAVKLAIEKLDVESPYNQTATMKIYTLGPAYTSAAYYQMLMIQKMVPTATITQGRDYTQLVALASAEDHKRIEELVEELADDPPADKAPSAVVYTLDEITPAAATRILGLAVTEAQVSTSDDPSQLVAWAKPKDHEKIAAVLEKIDVKGADDKAAKVVVYSLASSDSRRNSGTLSFLQQTITGGTFTMGSDYSQIIAHARPKDHEQIAEILAEFDKEPPADMAKVTEVYTLDVINATTASSLLRSVVPEADITTGRETNQFIAYARPVDHVKIKETLLKVDVESTDATTMVIYQLASSDGRRNYYSYIMFLQQEVPGATYTLGSTDASQLIVSARPKDHAKIAQIIEQIEKQASPETGPSLATYSLDHIRASQAMQLLGGVIPEATLTPGANEYQFMARATPKVHERIATTLKQIDVESDDGTTMVIYQLASSDSRRNYYTYLRFLPTEVPNATYSLGATDPSQLIVSARPTDHKKIAQIIQELEKEAPPELKPTLVTYSLQHVTASDATRLLNTIVPEAQLNPGANEHQFIAWATSKDHEKLASFIADLDKEETADSKPTTTVYDLEEITAATAEEILNVSLPEVTFEQGSDAKQLIAVARPVDQALIKSTLAVIDVQSPFDKESTVVIYTLQTNSRSGAYYQMQFMQTAVRNATFTLGSEIGQLVVRARPEDHKEIEELLEQLSKDMPLEKQPKAVFYALKEISPADALDMFDEVTPEAEVSTTNEGQLLVWATPKDHGKIAALLEQIDVPVPEEQMLQLVTYALKETTASVARQILQNAMPNAEFTLGADPKQLIVRARPKDHELVKSILDQIDIEGPTEAEGTLVLYEMEDMDYLARYYLMRMLRDVVPQASYSVSRDEAKMVVWSRPKDHEKIQQLIDLLAESPEKIPQAIVYSFNEINGSTARQILREAYPDLRIVPGADQQQLIIWARERDHAKVKATLEQIDVGPLEGTGTTVKVYDMKGFSERSVLYILLLLRDAVGNIRYFQGRDPTQAVIWATPKGHREIASILDQLAETPDTAHQAQIYNLKGIRASSVTTLLRSAVPDADFATGVDAYQLIAWARPDDQEKIKAAVDQLSEKEDEATAATMQVYSLETLDATSAIRLLGDVVPEAQFGAGANARQLIAWARPTDHEKIQATIQQMSKEEPPETAPRFQVYTAEATGATDAIVVLQAAVPEAEFNVGADSRQLIAYARPAEHETIKGALEQLATRGPEDSLPTIKVYSLETAGATNAVRVLQQALPETQFTIGDDRSKLIAWAYPEDHAVIEAAVKEIEADSWLEGNREMSVYSVRREDVDTLMQLLDPVLRQHAQFVTDDERESLIVWANKKYHESIKRTIDEFIEKLPEPVEPEVVVYRFDRSDPRSAYIAVSRLVPEAEISYDSVSRNLVVTALPEHQKRVRATIDEIEREDAGGQAPVLKIHRIRTADPSNLLIVLGTLFRTERDVYLSMDADNDSLIAYASPRHQARITELIGEVEKGALEDSTVTMQLHSLKNVDTFSSLRILTDALDKLGSKADLSTDYTRNALVAIARPEDHEKIAELLDELRGEEKLLEIFQLDYLELSTAERAIRQLFFEEPYQSVPQVEADYEMQQLYARATADQLAEIRRLLIQLGEVDLTSISGGGDSRLRVIDFKGDVQSVVEEIRRVWPQLRSNEMRVVTESDLAPEPETKPEPKPEPKTEPKPAEKPKPAPPAAEKPKPAAKPTEKPKAEAKPKPKPAAKPKAEVKPKPKPAAKPATPVEKPKPAAKPAAKPKAEVKPKPKPAAKPATPVEKPKPATKPATKPAAKPTEKPKAEAKPKPKPAAKPDPKPAQPAAAKSPSKTPEKTEEKKLQEKKPEPAKGAAGPEGNSGNSGVAGPMDADAKAKSTPGAPVTMMVGQGSVTIASDDLEALDQLESLLRNLSQRSGSAFSGRNYSVFELHNTSATAVSQTLQSMFRDKMTSSATSRTSSRSSSRYGYGSRYGSGYGGRPTPLVIVPDERLNTLFVQGTRSDRTLIESVIQMLDTDDVPETPAARKPKMIPIKNARASEVEQTIRSVFSSQLASSTSRTGGAAFAPRLAVDEKTNTLIVTAPAPLMDEIIEMAQSLDEKAGDNPAERVKIIRLKKANATRVEDALQKIIQGGGYRTSPRRR